MEEGPAKSSGVQLVFRHGRKRGADRGPPPSTAHPPSQETRMSLTRRDFTAKSAMTGAGVALAGSVGALATAPNALAATDSDTESAAEYGHDHGHGHTGVGYGPLIADPDGLLALPAGFKYRVITYSG